MYIVPIAYHHPTGKKVQKFLKSMGIIRKT
jgi:hypothetical protein